jgi:predicted TIM-barrel fold metal-dependent hydrolase
VQWYAGRSHLPRIAELQAHTRLTFVLDHLAGWRADEPASDDSRRALDHLAAAGAWVKLSGWYRLGATAPYQALVPGIRDVAELFGDRLVWGSDWPHTGQPPQAPPRYASLLQPVREALGEHRLAGCLRAARLYA